MPPIPDTQHNCRFHVDGNTLVFSDGYWYFFADGRGLKEAFTVKCFPEDVPATELPTMNHRLGRVGDSVLKSILLGGWYAQRDRQETFNRLFDHGMGMDTYLAAMADMTGITKQLEISGLSILDGPSYAREYSNPGEWGDFWSMKVKEKATAVEALVAAVFFDSGGDHATTREVMRRLGLYWPANSKQWKTLESMWARLREQGVVGPKERF